MAKHKISAVLMFMALIVLFISCTVENTGTDTDAKDNIFVLVNYKSQPGKHKEALAALNSLILDVKNEPNFVNIKLFADPSDETNILLYEQWSDEEYYKGEHMNTPHLQKFMGDAREFLAGPPNISFWKLNNDYTANQLLKLFMKISKLTTNGRITIPAPLRKKYGLTPGRRVKFKTTEDGTCLAGLHTVRYAGRQK